MAKATLLLEAVRRTAVDARLAQLGDGKLTRAAGVTYLEFDGDVSQATHELALAGIRVSSSSPPALVTGLRPAIAFDLEPLEAALGAVDVVEFMRIPLSEATAALLRRRLPWLPGSQAGRGACLRLLRGDDAMIGWRRMMWCSVAAMRVARRHIRLRPVVFDRAAVDRHTLRWTYARDGAIERWAFA